MRYGRAPRNGTPLAQGKLPFARETVEEAAVRTAPPTAEVLSAIEADQAKRKFIALNTPKPVKRRPGRPRFPRVLHPPEGPDQELLDAVRRPEPIPDLNRAAPSRSSRTTTGTKTNWWIPSTIIPILKEVKSQGKNITGCVNNMKMRCPEIYGKLAESTVRRWYEPRNWGLDGGSPQLTEKSLRNLRTGCSLGRRGTGRRPVFDQVKLVRIS